MDTMLEFLGGGNAPALPGHPKRILLSNLGHLGDVLISTSVLPVLKSAYPDVRIGFVAGRWAQPILSGHPMVDQIHIVDHWFLNRATQGKAEKIRRFLKTTQTALREIRALQYDIAINLYSYFPNAIPLTWKAGVPVRIGFTSGGFGPLLTHPVPFRQSGKHESEYQADLLHVLGIGKEHLDRLKMTLPDPTPDTEINLCRVLGRESLDGPPYRLIHMGSGAGVTHEWPLPSWRALAEKLRAGGRMLVFTGIGNHEREQIEAVTAGLKDCHNLCDRLDWWGFVEAIRQAEIVYSVDTSAGHIAAAVNTPCVSVFGGISDIPRWRPKGEYCSLITKEVVCAPCYKVAGCETMECVQDIATERVYAAGEELLRVARSRNEHQFPSNSR
jgi:ADP-heptose:LPS heptosyltransferase